MLRGKVLPFSHSPVRDVLKKKGDTRVIVFENGARKQVTKGQLKGLVAGAIANLQRGKALRSIRPVTNGVKFKLKNFSKSVERAARSREHAVKMIEKIYGKGETRGTRFSKVSKFGQMREAARAAIHPGNAKYIK